MVRLAEDARWRRSKRGLVLASGRGETVLFEHPHAHDLPAILADDPAEPVVAQRLGPPLHAAAIADMVALGICTTAATPAVARSAASGRPVTLDRHGLMLRGVRAPAHWLDRWLVPPLLHLIGRIVVAIVVVAGIVALLAGRPAHLPAVSESPTAEILLMILLGLIATVAHEMAHAVSMAHFGRSPERGGFGFYWGAISFFIDSTPALTLPRRQRVIQALAGLMVDTVAAAVFALAAHLVPNDTVAVACWRLAILTVVDIAINLAPVLQVDGHWALADYLDEPDLAPRARRSLGAAISRRLPPQHRWLAAYGATSIVAGLALLATLGVVFWNTTKEVLTALFRGNALDITLGVYYTAPLVIGLTLSALGLILEIVGDTKRPSAEPSEYRPVADST